ncbi:DUF3667 domain-containing protein [Muricauda sp. MAR_2010_75]|jgi:hypothetical protein|uniref:DUF3667 domain-containing protein n=1 Tax=Allomuricauda sp. MAR_2010_75 TaxID=1250232 RepID=UPI0005653973|nr:DUF3667 domain-containing protein [Muricauda sp. MAR_2010_75]
MECKNCHANLQSLFDYCPTCGAKVIHKRLTLKNVSQDLGHLVFNLDNTLFKTFRHLISLPEVVITSYISGVRKKYMNPTGYFAIAATLGGLLIFILRNIYHVNLTHSSITDQDNPYMVTVFDYRTLLAYLILPFYALFTWLLFLGRKKMNYTEHLVANAYIIGQVSFVQVIVSLILFGLLKLQYDVFNWVYLLITIVYQFYVLGKIHQTRFGGTFFRGLAYLVLLSILMIAIGSLIIYMLLWTGQVSMEMLSPK